MFTEGLTKEEKKAYEIAKKAHKGQVDKAGVDYINHPLTVASKCQSEDERIVALLHDVVEDTDVTLEDLSKVFDKHIIDAIDAITHREGVSYEDYLLNLKKNELALHVKFKDIENNMDLSRIKNPTQKDYDRLEKYRFALNVLNSK